MLDPAGKVIAESDWEREGAAESLWALAEATGDFEIRITASGRNWSDPRYLIKVEKIADLQTAPLADSTYVKAYQAVWKAKQLHLQGSQQSSQQASQQSMREAAEDYSEAIKLFRELNDKVAEAIALMEVGQLNLDMNEREK